MVCEEGGKIAQGSLGECSMIDAEVDADPSMVSCDWLLSWGWVGGWFDFLFLIWLV